MRNDRRLFLTQATRLLSLAALSAAFPGTALGKTALYPFSLGVASESPREPSIVLWTRILPAPLNAESSGKHPFSVQWEMAEDEGFTRIAAKGNATALPELAHNVHVDVAGLKPDHWYWYRFMLGNAVSPIGRTRTAPAADIMPSSLRLTFPSCQHWEFGEYAAHRHIAAEAPDLVAFLSDYITEFCGTSVTSESRPQSRTEQYVVQNPHIRYGRSDVRRFVMMEVRPARVSTRFQALADVCQAQSPVSTIARFVVEDGKPGLIRGS